MSIVYGHATHVLLLTVAHISHPLYGCVLSHHSSSFVVGGGGGGGGTHLDSGQGFLATFIMNFDIFFLFFVFLWE